MTIYEDCDHKCDKCEHNNNCTVLNDYIQYLENELRQAIRQNEFYAQLCEFSNTDPYLETTKCSKTL